MRRGSRTVLLVHDERMISDVGAQMLKGFGYTVLVAAGGAGAVKNCRENRDGSDLVIPASRRFPAG